MQLFYCPDISSTPILPIDEARHCIKVLRKKTGDEIDIIDGKGNLYQAELLNDNFKKCEVKITNTISEFGKRDKYLHIAIAPTKNLDRIEWFVEKAVEIGVDKISFILTSNSERRNLKLDRIEKKAISAMKQSIKATLPILNELTTLKEFVSNCTNNQRFIAHLENEPKSLTEFELKNNICMLIGPEGGFSEEEIDIAKEYNFTPTLLGKSRLRTETAGIVSCVILN